MKVLFNTVVKLARDSDGFAAPQALDIPSGYYLPT